MKFDVKAHIIYHEHADFIDFIDMKRNARVLMRYLTRGRTKPQNPKAFPTMIDWAAVRCTIPSKSAAMQKHLAQKIEVQCESRKL